jgi:hypothetical protein
VRQAFRTLARVQGQTAQRICHVPFATLTHCGKQCARSMSFVATQIARPGSARPGSARFGSAPLSPSEAARRGRCRA